jgi:hypothetical protein
MPHEPTFAVLVAELTVMHAIAIADALERPRAERVASSP